MNNLAELVNKHLIGFDDLFNRVDRDVSSKQSYPPYNMVRITPETTRVDIAVAGFSKEDLSVTIEDNILCVRGFCVNKDANESLVYLHKGISYRSWQKKWTLSNALEVESVKLTDGILSIVIVHKVPEDKKPLQLEIE